MIDDPEALAEEEEEQKRGEALRAADLDARKCHAATSVGKGDALSGWVVGAELCLQVYRDGLGGGGVRGDGGSRVWWM